MFRTRAQNPSVAIIEEGRSGRVIYQEPGGSIAGHWEFGGGDVTAILSMGSAAEWRSQAAWALARRGEILRFIGEEVCRQRSPSSRADIDEDSGTICLRPSGAERPAAPSTARPTGPAETARAFVTRHSRLRSRFAMFVAFAAVALAVVLWLAKSMFSIQPGPGNPIGLCVRTDRHVATWISSLEPYIPSLHRDPSKNRYTLSVLLIPLDGAEPQLVPVHRGLEPNSFSLAQILGSDGTSLWVDGHGLRRIELADLSVHEATGPEPKNLLGARRASLPPRPEHFLARAAFLGTSEWLGLVSASEAENSYRVGGLVRRGNSLLHDNDGRRLHRALIEPFDPAPYQRIASIESLADTAYYRAGLLRQDPDGEPLVLRDPVSLLLFSESSRATGSTVVLSRVDLQGKPLWRTDTGIDHFTVEQLLPGERASIVVGTRPRQPDRVPEPILAIVDSATGALVVHSLWR